jgi:hypothetical protein
MANGRKGDDPFMDILYHKIQRFSPTADALIAEIVQLGGKKELEKTFNLYKPPPISEFEESLRQIRERLYREAKERGWEV